MGWYSFCCEWEIELERSVVGRGVEGQVNVRAPKDHLLLAASQFGKKFATYVFFFVGNETHCTGKQLPREGSTIP